MDGLAVVVGLLLVLVLFHPIVVCILCALWLTAFGIGAAMS